VTELATYYSVRLPERHLDFAVSEYWTLAGVAARLKPVIFVDGRGLVNDLLGKDGKLGARFTAATGLAGAYSRRPASLLSFGPDRVEKPHRRVEG
jgi:hypothetical protein